MRGRGKAVGEMRDVGAWAAGRCSGAAAGSTLRAWGTARADGAVRAWRERGRQLKRGVVRRRVDRAQPELGPTASAHQAERGGWRGHRRTAMLVLLERTQRGARLREVAARNSRVQLRAGSLSSILSVLCVRAGPRGGGVGDGSQRAAKHAQPATRRARIARIALPPPAVHTTRQERQRVSAVEGQPPSAWFDLRARTYRAR